MTGTLQQYGLYERARAYVSKIPAAIEGNHGDCQTLAVANALLWDFALSPSEALSILREYNARCSPPWTEAELIRKLRSAEKQPHSKPRGNLLGEKSSYRRMYGLKPRSPLPKPHIDPGTAVENFLKGFRCDEVDLWECSPIRPPDNWTKDAIALLENLYHPGERINFITAFKRRMKKDGTIRADPDGYGTTTERNQLIHRWCEQGMPRSEAGGWLRMNPMDGQGTDDANVRAYRFALLECDGIPLDLQIPLFARLPLPVAALLNSGGKSIHAWVMVDEQSAGAYRHTVSEMLTLLAPLGIDHENKNPSRLSRLPGVVRTIGATGDGKQRLLYLNPNPKQGAIL